MFSVVFSRKNPASCNETITELFKSKMHLIKVEALLDEHIEWTDKWK